MSQKTLTINQAAKPAKKCLTCGLTNFSDRKRCTRCKSDLSLPVTAAKNAEPIPENTSRTGRSKILILIVAGNVLFWPLLFFYKKRPAKKKPQTQKEEKKT